MKRSDFSVPRRQSQWAVVFIILRFVRKLFSQLWFLFIPILLGRGGSSFDRYEIIASLFGVFGMISSVIAYYRYYYRVSEKELVIKYGLFKKVKLNIPFERIQSVNFRQTVLHRFLQVTEIEIETAGSTEQETKLDALSLPHAEALRKLLLEKRKAAIADVDVIEGVHSKAMLTDESEVVHDILMLNANDLLKVGLTRNHLAPVGLLGGLLVSSFFYAEALNLEMEDMISQLWEAGKELTITQGFLLVLVALVLSILFSIAKTFLKYYKLRFWRSGEKFQVEQGLLTRREFAALDKKIQIFNWGQNPIEKWMKILNIRFRQARSGGKESASMQFDIPGCDQERVEYVKQEWLGYQPRQFSSYAKVSSHYFWHFAIYAVPLFLLAGSLFIVYLDTIQGIGIIIFGCIATGLRWIAYKKKKYAVNNKELYIGGGTLGHRHSLLPLFKVQNASIEQTPYQWRRGLSSLRVFTAAGTVSIPYIKLDDAKSLVDELLYKVETSNKSWM